MSYSKCYTRVNWENEPSVNTALNETNLNVMDSAINTLDDRTVALDSRMTTIEGMEPTFVGYMTRAETAATSAEASDVSAESYAKGGTSSRTGEDTDNAKYYSQQSSASATSAETSAEDSEAWAVGTRNGTAVGSTDETYHNNAKYYSDYAVSYSETSESYAKGGTGTRTGEDTDNALYYKNTASTSATNASTSATLSESWAVGGTSSRAGEDTNNSYYFSGISESHAEDSEAWAVGQRNGTDVGSSDATYHNNSLYWANQSQSYAGTSETFSISSENYSKVATTMAANASGFADDALSYKNIAVTMAANASTSADNAEDSAEDSEAWSVGKRNGVDVPSSDETYHNNAKYWAEQASSAAGGGVTSFNGRHGAVEPTVGDYNASQITYGSGTAESGLDGSIKSVTYDDTNDQLIFTKNDTTTVPVTISAGHTIVNEQGTSFTNRKNLQFGDKFSVTDDPTNDKTIIAFDGTEMLKATYEGDTSSSAHSTDEFLYWDDKFVKTTTSISIGDTITDTGANANVTTNTGIEADTQIYVLGYVNGSKTYNAIFLSHLDGTGTEYGNSNTGGYIVYPEFDINNNGHLIAEGGSGVDYSINSSGHLIATPQ